MKNIPDQQLQQSDSLVEGLLSLPCCHLRAGNVHSIDILHMRVTYKPLFPQPGPHPTLRVRPDDSISIAMKTE